MGGAVLVKPAERAANESGFWYPQVYPLGAGEATENGLRWLIDLREEGNGQVFTPWTPQDPDWKLPWESKDNAGAYHLHHLNIRVSGGSGVKLESVQASLDPNIAYLSGTVTDASGDPVAGDISFIHSLPLADGKTGEVRVENVIGETGYFVALPLDASAEGFATDYRVMINGRICGIDPGTVTAPVEGNELNIVVGEGVPAEIAITSPTFEVQNDPADPMVCFVDADSVTLTGYVNPGCSGSRPVLTFQNLSGGGQSNVTLSSSVDASGRYTFTYPFKPTYEGRSSYFNLQLSESGGALIAEKRFEMRKPTKSIPEIVLGDGYTTFELPRFSQAGETFSFELQLRNIGDETPEICYLSLSASNGLELAEVACGNVAALINADTRSVYTICNDYHVSNYPVGSTIWKSTGETMAALNQLVDIRGENQPAAGLRESFQIKLRATAAALGKAQWVQYRAAFKTNEGEPAEYQALYPAWADVVVHDQQGYPCISVEAPYTAQSGDAFPDDPAASVDSDGDGHPDFWDPNATAAQVAASDLTIDAFPYDATRWVFEYGDSGTTDIAGAEYFFNTDPGIGRGTPISPADGILNEPLEGFDRYQVSTDGLAPGIHRLYMRVKNDKGVWSSVRTAYIQIVSPRYGNQSSAPDERGNYWELLDQLSQGEYFFGQDPGIGLGVPFKPADGVYSHMEEAFDVQAPVPGAIRKLGNYTLSLRVRDKAGAWSPVRTVVFELDTDGDGVSDGADAFPRDPAASLDTDGDGFPDCWNENATADQIARSYLVLDFYPDDPARWSLPPNLMAAECFIDTDPGYGKGEPILPVGGAFDQPLELMQRYEIPTTGLQTGVHTLYVRVRDRDGVWSPLQSSYFEVVTPEYGNQSHAPVTRDSYWREQEPLAAGEYFFGNDPGTRLGVAFSPADGAYDHMEEVFDLQARVPGDIETLGIYTLSVRVQNQAGNWSSVQAATFELDTDGDGVSDGIDAFPRDPAASLDTDGDGYPDCWNPNATAEQIDQSKLIIDAYYDDPTRWAFPGNLVAAEFFIDTDPGEGEGQSILPLDGQFDQPIELMQQFEISTTGLTPGVHTLYVRVQDSEGLWSIVQIGYFEIVEPVAGTFVPHLDNVSMDDRPNIIAAEYFIGADPGAGNGTAIPPIDGSSDLAIRDFNAEINPGAGLTGPIASIFVRIRDENGVWSSAYRARVSTNQRGLSLTLPSDAGEGDGKVKGTVTITEILDEDLPVSLTSSDTTEATVPDSVIIAKGNVSVDFDVTLLDDGEVDGDQTITIEASADGWVSGSAEMIVKDSGNADISVSKGVSASSVVVGQTVVFTVTAQNKGPSDATGVEITDALPAGLTYESDNSGGAYHSDTGLWRVGELANGETAEVKITARVNQEGSITNTAERSASSPKDPTAANDAASATVTGTPVLIPGTLQFSAATYNVNEDAGKAVITLTRTGGSDGAVSVSYATSDVSATADDDYTAASGIRSWEDGETASKTFEVVIIHDSVVEGDETVNLTLSNPTGGATLGTPSTGVLTIVEAVTKPTVTTHTEVSDITDTSAICGGNVTSDGGAEVTARGICWSTSADPTTDDNVKGAGSGKGDFTAELTGLEPGSEYHVRAYATNSAGTAYGNDVSFSTQRVLAAPGGVPDTGQTKFYNNTVEIPCPEPGEAFYGQDASYLINLPSYTKLDVNGNDLPDSAAEWVMVRDNVTGLIWEVKTDDGSIHDKDNKYTWRNVQEIFIARVNAEKYGGHSDWRVPSIEELSTLANLGRYEPAIDIDYFPNTVWLWYWSSTTYADQTGCGWSVYFRYGYFYWYDKSNENYVRAVRGTQIPSSDHLITNGDKTVTDTARGLMWQQTTAESICDWQTAIAYCEAILFADYDDWRLPNERELQSIVDYSQHGPAIDKSAFPETASSGYWSSTANATYTGDAWGINFVEGNGGWASKSKLYYVRAVRGGQTRVSGHLIILAPGQGSIWAQGDIMPIKWDTAELGGNVTISISRQGGKAGTFETIATGEPNDGAYDWPVTGPGSFNCMLRIEPTADPAKGTTQGLFSIEAAGESGTLQFKSATYSVNEDGGSVRIFVTRTGGSYGAAAVNYDTANGTATAGSDYTAKSGPLTWADGDAADKYFDVPITNDSTPENAETFTVTLSNATGATLGSPTQTTVTINGPNDQTDCPPCSGENPEVRDVRFEAGRDCECVGTSSMTIGPNVAVEKGAKVVFKAPRITVTSGVHAEEGAIVEMKQND